MLKLTVAVVIIILITSGSMYYYSGIIKTRHSVDESFKDNINYTGCEIIEFNDWNFNKYTVGLEFKAVIKTKTGKIYRDVYSWDVYNNRFDDVEWFYFRKSGIVVVCH